MNLTLTPVEHKALLAWLRDRIDEMKPDRASIREENDCDLVAVLQRVEKTLSKMPPTSP